MDRPGVWQVPEGSGGRKNGENWLHQPPLQLRDWWWWWWILGQPDNNNKKLTCGLCCWPTTLRCTTPSCREEHARKSHRLPCLYKRLSFSCNSCDRSSCTRKGSVHHSRWHSKEQWLLSRAHFIVCQNNGCHRHGWMLKTILKKRKKDRIAGNALQWPVTAGCVPCHSVLAFRLSLPPASHPPCHQNANQPCSPLLWQLPLSKTTWSWLDF